MKTTRVLSNGEFILITTTEIGSYTYYNATVTENSETLGFEGDFGKIEDGETVDIIADKIEFWMNENITKTGYHLISLI